MEELVNILKEKKLTIGSVESLTGGLFASSLASIPGVSSVFKGALVTYAIEIKENVCHVPCEIIDKYGVVSSECAYEMAKHGAQVLNTDVTISFTGNAGPLCLDNKPVGTIFVGICYKNEVQTFKYELGNKSRNEIREAIVLESISLLKKILKEKD